MSINYMKSLSHSKWRCKYHIVFAPKYRRQIIYGKIKVDIGRILRELCERKKVNIIEGECCPDYIHLLVEIPPYLSITHLEYTNENMHVQRVLYGHGRGKTRK